MAERSFFFGVMLSVSCAERASAAPPNVRLELERAPSAEECLDAPSLERAVEERVQRRVVNGSGPADLALRVRFTGERSWSVSVTLADREGPLGSRTLTTRAGHCSALDDSLALVIALLVETPAAMPPRGVPPPDAPGPQQKNNTQSRGTPARQGVPVALAVPGDTLAPRAPFAFDVRATAEGSVGVQPGMAAGVELALGVKPPRGPWVRATGELFGATERRAGAEPGSVRVSTRRLGLEFCSPFGELTRFFEYSGCVGQRVGQLRVDGEGFDAVRSTSRLYYGLVAGGQGLIPFGALGVLLGVDVELPLTRDRFTARPDGVRSVELGRVAPVAGTAKLGVRVAF